MKPQFSVRILLFCLLVVAVLCVVFDFVSIELKIRRVEKAVAVDKIRDHFRELFSTVSISRLKGSRYDSVAIQAHWEQLLHRRTANELSRPSHTELEEFLEAVERRGEVPVPNWWSEIVHTVQIDSEFIPLVSQPRNFLKFAFDLDKIKTPVDCELKKKNNVFSLTVDENSIAIPRFLLHESNEGIVCSNVSACFTANRCFILSYYDGVPYLQVGCICRDDGALIWNSIVNEICYYWGPMWATISANKNRVGVFGVSTKGIYAYGFDAETGKTIYRFSSSF